MKSIAKTAVKVERVIKSCKTIDQLVMARMMFNLFDKQVPNKKLYFNCRTYMTEDGEMIKYLKGLIDMQELAIHTAKRILLKGE